MNLYQESKVIATQVQELYRGIYMRLLDAIAKYPGVVLHQNVLDTKAASAHWPTTWDMSILHVLAYRETEVSLRMNLARRLNQFYSPANSLRTQADCFEKDTGRQTQKLIQYWLPEIAMPTLVTSYYHAEDTPNKTWTYRYKAFMGHAESVPAMMTDLDKLVNARNKALVLEQSRLAQMTVIT